jgi:hypothetical protein
MQCTWAEVGEEIGLSESMIYQVKSGARQLSPKAEFRLSIAERKAGLAPPIEDAIRSAENESQAVAAFKKASISEQLKVFQSEPGLWHFWLEMRLMDLSDAIKNQVTRAESLASLVQALSKARTDEKLHKETLALSKECRKQAKELELLFAEHCEAIHEIATALRKSRQI